MSPWIDPDLHEVRKKQSQNLIQMLESILDFNFWGFQQTYLGLSRMAPPVVTYDSQWCRIQFALSGGDRYSGDEMHVFYGRLHAPNDAAVMTWNGEECFCWHQVFEALNFLDGLSPQEAIDQIRVKSEWPRVAENFKQSERGKELALQSHAEWITNMHAAIWEAYGERLFELFDLRQPDLWNQYRHFVSEYYLLKGLRAPIPGYPTHDKIC